MEDAIFPHASSMVDPAEMEEERRLAYVAITRARERLYLTHALRRSLYGREQYNPPSRFLEEMPDEFVKVTGVGLGRLLRRRVPRRHGAALRLGLARRRGRARRGDAVRRRLRRRRGGRGGQPSGRVFGSGAPRPKPAEELPQLAVGDSVEHKVFGRGTVKAVEGDKVTIAFAPPAGTKKVLLGYAPIRRIR